VNVVFVSPWKVRCGIAKYTEYLTSELAKFDDLKVMVVPQPRTGIYTTQTIEWLFSKILKCEPNIVHIQHEYALWRPIGKGLELLLMKLVKGRGIKVVTTMHNVGLFEIDNEITKLSDVVIVHNKWCWERLASESKSNVVIIPHGTYVKIYDKNEVKKKLGISSNVKLIGVPGFVSKYKQFDIALNVYFEVRKRVSNVKLVVIGGWHFDIDKTFSVIDEVKKYVYVTGWLEDEDFDMWISACDLILYPTRYVTESGVVCRCLGLGKCVVTFNHEVFSDRPVVTCKSVEEMIEKTIHLLQDENYRLEIEEKAIEWAKDRTWDKIAQTHKQIYEVLLNKGEVVEVISKINGKYL